MKLAGIIGVAVWARHQENLDAQWFEEQLQALKQRLPEIAEQLQLCTRYSARRSCKNKESDQIMIYLFDIK